MIRKSSSYYAVFEEILHYKLDLDLCHQKKGLCARYEASNTLSCAFHLPQEACLHVYRDIRPGLYTMENTWKLLA